MWAIPDLDGFAHSLRRLLTDPAARAIIGERARERAARLRPEATATAVASRLADIRAERASADGSVAAPSDDAGDDPVARSGRWLREGPTRPWDAPAPAGTKAARSALLRAMRPYLERRGEFDVALVQADEQAAARLASAERRLLELETDERALREESVA